MKQTIKQVITWLLTLGASFDVIYSVLADNQGLLIELGVSPKVTKVVMLIGLLWSAFNKSINPLSTNSLIGTRPNDR